MIPIAEIGTDRHRLDAWTADDATAFNAFGDGHDWNFSAFRKSDGYVAVPLDGVWLRAPYLHNGSVPSLADLLEPPERRPRSSGADTTSTIHANVGFVSSGPEAQRIGTLHDVAKPATATPATRTEQSFPPNSKRVSSRVPEDPMRRRI